MLATWSLMGALLLPAQTAATSPPAKKAIEPSPAPARTAPAAGEWLLTPRLTAGQELIYKGLFSEQAGGDSVQLQRKYRLENRVFILDAGARGVDLAVLTLLRDEVAPPARTDERTTLKQTDNPDARSARLERLQLDALGRTKGELGLSLSIPLQGPPPLECGFFVAVPAGRLGVDKPWTVSEPGRPETTWRVTGSDVQGTTTCLRLLGEQKSSDWDTPHGDGTSWRRQDVVWISPKLGIAQRVERRLEVRPAGDVTTSYLSTLTYDLQSPLQYPIGLAEDRRRELLQTTQLQASARPLLAQPIKNGPQLDVLLARAKAAYDAQSKTPYREALAHLRQRLEAGRRGEIPPELPATIFQPDPPTPRIKQLTLGKPAPEFVAADLCTPKCSVSLRGLRGKPVLMIFFHPDSRYLDDLMTYVHTIRTKHPDLQLVGLTMAGDAPKMQALVREKKWSMPIIYGPGLRHNYQVECTPHLVVLDREGIARGVVAGWGSESPAELQAELIPWLREGHSSRPQR